MRDMNTGYVGNREAIEVKEPPSPIVQQLSEMAKWLEELSRTVSELENRLSYVMGEEEKMREDTSGKSAPIPPPVSMIVAVMRDRNNDLRRIVDRLSTIIHRLEV